MVDKPEETVHAVKTPGRSNPETDVLRHITFKTYMLLFFRDLNKTQIYKMPWKI